MAAWRARPLFCLLQACRCCVMLMSLSAGCPSASGPSPPERLPSLDYRKAGPDLSDMLTDAWLTNRQDDRITLAQLLPSNAVTDSMVSRPRLGDNVTFRCEVPTGSNERDVSWLHQDRTVFEAGRPLGDTPEQQYSFSCENRSLMFQILNISMASGGSVQCIAVSSAPSAYSPRPRVLQRFMLLPLITRRTEVFGTPDATHLTATEGDEVFFQCYVRLPLPEGLLMNKRNHLIWRHNGRVVYGPSEAPYGAFMPIKSLSKVSKRTAQSTKIQPTNWPEQLIPCTYHFPAVTLGDAGQMQCLFRPHQGIHEWIVQTMTLTVTGKKKAQ